MVTNDERREAAARLRELPSDMYEVEERWEAEGIDTDCHDQTDYYLIHDVLLGCLPADHMHPCDYEELHNRLADLIAPEPERTCRRVSKSVAYRDGLAVESRVVCSACGRALRARSVYRYCPNCGAKLVE